MIQVVDEFGAAADPALPSLVWALDPAEVKAEFKRGLPRLATAEGVVEVKSIRVLRHKPGRRCVIEYDVRVERPGGVRRKTMLIGKVRARRFGSEAYRLQDAVWNAGFKRHSSDAVSVPEPIGVIPRFQMWLQRKVAGRESTALLPAPDGPEVARRIAEAICKLHRAGVPVDKRHTLSDELRILHECLPRAAGLRPDLSGRIERLQQASDRLGRAFPQCKPCGIHRDFYPAQVLLKGRRLYLLDFDLYCLGDPALDAGNFLGHVIEQSLRQEGGPRALGAVEDAFTKRFLELSPSITAPAVQAYTSLTLVRHVYLSTQFADRQPFTGALLGLCEQRLQAHL